MRIEGKDITTKLGRLGLVKVGKKRESGSPMSLDYFRFVVRNNSLREQQMEKIFGKEPKQLPIMFYTSDRNESCSNFLLLNNYDGRKIAYGNGSDLFFRSTPEGMKKENPADYSSTGEEYMYKLAKKYTKVRDGKEFVPEWEEVLRLRFMIIGCQDFGYWEFWTGGVDTSIPQIVSTYDLVEGLAANAGMDIAGAKFWLTVEKHKSQQAESKRVYPVVNLIPIQNMGEDQLLAGAQKLLGGAKDKPETGEGTGGVQ